MLLALSSLLFKFTHPSMKRRFIPTMASGEDHNLRVMSWSTPQSSPQSRRCHCHHIGLLEELPTLHAIIDKSPQSFLATTITLLSQSYTRFLFCFPKLYGISCIHLSGGRTACTFLPRAMPSISLDECGDWSRMIFRRFPELALRLS